MPLRVPSRGGSFLVPRADADEFAADSLLEGDSFQSNSTSVHTG